METVILEPKKVRGDILRLIVPVAMENMLQMLAGIVTTAMVGRLLADDIAAQGISNRVYNTCFALFRGLGMGATVVAALHYGAGRLGRCRRTIEQTYLTAVPLALLFLGLVLLFPRQLLGFFTEDPALLETATAYARVSIWAIPFMTVIAVTTAAFHSHGDTRTPMMIAAVMNVVNIAVSYAAIFGVGPVGGMGIRGAAIATVLTQAVGCAIGLVLVYRKNRGLFAASDHGRPFFSLDRAEVRDVLASGVPIACENLFWQFSAIILSKVILSFGSHFYAAYQLGLQAEMLTEMPSAGFMMAATTLTARAIGRRDGTMYRAYYKALVRMSFLVGLAGSLILLLVPRGIMAILTDKEQLQAIGAVYVFIMGFAQVPQVMSKVYNGVIRASGGKRVPMYVSFVGIWIVRVPIAVLTGWVLGWDIMWIWAAISLDQIVRMAISVAYIRAKDIPHYVERQREQEERRRAATLS